MTTAYTSLLGLALPVTGELQGAWGDTVNNGLTSLLDVAVAGTTTLSTDVDVTLTTTTGAANQARQAILLCSGARTVARNITAPAQSKIYTVINATTGGFSVVLRGVGPTTGVTVVAGESAVVAWNGSDFIKVSNTAGVGTFTNLTVTGNATLGDADTDTITQAASYVTGTQLKSAKTATNTLNLAAYDVGGTAYTNLVTLTASNTPTLALTSTGVGTINNMSVGATTASTGAFTTLTTSSTVTHNGGTANGVAYLNGSKVLTTGSALTFDGTMLTANAASVGGTLGLVVGGALNGTTINSVGVALGGTQTLSIGGGTANGVAYLNGSKVLTTGSALTFDGAILGVNGISVGRGAGAVSTNTAVGAIALLSNTTGARNSIFGNASGLQNTTGSDNSVFGYDAFELNTTGASNTAVGSQSVYSNTTGSNNVGVGYRALFSNTTATSNTAIGGGAMYLSTTGGNNTALGYQSLYSNTTASNNTAVGYQAGYSNTTGTYNTASGASALYSNTTGSNNTASGASALYSNTTGSSNVASGLQALNSSTTGTQNTAIGLQALTNSTTASNNTAVGYQAGYSTTGGNNVFVGLQAGVNVSTGAGNTIVGAFVTGVGGAGSQMTTGAKNTIIGAYNGNQGGLDIRTANNNVVLSDGDGNPRGIFDSGGNFLVGVSSYPTGSTVGAAINGALGLGTFSRASDASLLINTNTDSQICRIYRSGSQVGNISVTTVAAFYNSNSDYRLKTVSGAVSGSGERIDALQPVEYTWNSNGQHTRGFLAHQFQEVYASSVNGTKDAMNSDGNPEYQTMQASSSEVIADLVAEIQSLRKRLAAAGI